MSYFSNVQIRNCRQLVCFKILLYILTRVNPCAYKCTLQRQPAAKNRHEKVGHVNTFGRYCGHHFGFNFNHTNGRSVDRCRLLAHVFNMCPHSVLQRLGLVKVGESRVEPTCPERPVKPTWVACQGSLGSLYRRPV